MKIVAVHDMHDHQQQQNEGYTNMQEVEKRAARPIQVGQASLFGTMLLLSLHHRRDGFC
jgi:hypothetical protein